jgi:hypothetical protein
MRGVGTPLVAFSVLVLKDNFVYNLVQKESTHLDHFPNSYSLSKFLNFSVFSLQNKSRENRFKKVKMLTVGPTT